MHSMTGYAKAVLEDPRARVTVEIKSLNHRFLKVGTSLPSGLASLDPQISRLVKGRVLRGTVSVAVQFETLEGTGAFTVNKGVLLQYRDTVARIFAELGIHGGVSPDTLVSLPGVIESRDPTEELTGDAWSLVEKATEQALEQLIEMRAAEGLNLEADLQGHLEVLRAQMALVKARQPDRQQGYRDRLLQKLEEVLEPERIPISPADIVREVAIYAERIDISEEISRMASHIDQFAGVLSQDGEVGRRLEFFTQEMFREANTMGSKSGDAELTQATIEIKTALEKIKEQLQNVE